MQISVEGDYAVRQPTAHAVNENHRVRCFRQMLLGPLDTTEQLLNLGELMYQVKPQYSPNMLSLLLLLDTCGSHAVLYG